MPKLRTNAPNTMLCWVCSRPTRLSCQLRQWRCLSSQFSVISFPSMVHVPLTNIQWILKISKMLRNNHTIWQYHDVAVIICYLFASICIYLHLFMCTVSLQGSESFTTDGRCCCGAGIVAESLGPEPPRAWATTVVTVVVQAFTMNSGRQRQTIKCIKRYSYVCI